jgi:signal transduction histidine kinase/CheY-like chemotaxis protein
MQDGPDTARATGTRPRAVSRDRLFYSSLLCALACLVFDACVWLTSREAAASISVWVAGSALFNLGMAAVARSERLPRSLLPAAGSALALAQHATLLYALIRNPGPGLTLFAALVVLGAGVMQSSTRWLVVTLVLAVGSWLVAGMLVFPASFVLSAAGLVLVAFVSLFVHLFVVRHLTHLKELRRRDRTHGEALAEALAAARHELTERQRAEAERERLREQPLHAQKLEAIGTLAGGVAHDMNNMLAVILGVAELAREDPSTAREGIDQILDAARRGSELVRNLLGFSRRGQYRVERVELGSVVAGITGLLSRALPREIELVSASRAAVQIEGDAAQLGQALLNLCINASDAMNGRGTLRIEIGEQRLAGERARELGVPDGSYAALAVSDTGCGMDAATRARMFEPFFTTKAPGRGTGLGLAMVYGTITNHGGAVAVDTEPGRGTSITLFLPAIAVAEESAPPVEAPAAPPIGATEPAPGAGGQGGLVLLVDDEPLVRSVTRRSLERAGYRVVTAGDGAEGVAVFEERAAEIAVVLLDMAMPVMGGAECFRRIREIEPRARVLLASGYAMEAEARACLASGALGFLEKPFATAALLERIASARSDRRAAACG